LSGRRRYEVDDSEPLSPNQYFISSGGDSPQEKGKGHTKKAKRIYLKYLADPVAIVEVVQSPDEEETVTPVS